MAKKTQLPDVHKEEPKISGITLNRAGVENIKFPLTVKQKDGVDQVVNATFSMFGSLTSKIKGVNMSRMPCELMERWVKKPLRTVDFKDLLHSLRSEVQSQDVYVSSEFDYFMKKTSPVSKIEGIMSYACKFIAILYPTKYNFIMELNVPVSSTCPCSKELCMVDGRKKIGKGAHNQRGLIMVQVKTRPSHSKLWLEDLIPLIESCGSCEVYPILKRPDEKYVTEKGYNNPKFVEDIARDVLYTIRTSISKVCWIRVRVKNYESIHPHNAVAYCEQTRRGRRWWRSDKGFYG